MSRVNEYVGNYDKNLTGQTGLAAPFVLLGDKHLKPGGRLALVLPSAVVNRYSWEPVREMLAENYHIEHMILSWKPGKPAWSEDTRIREVLLIARKQKPSESKDKKTLVTHVDEDINFAEGREIAEKISQTNPSNISIREPNALELYSGGKKLGAAKSFPAAFFTDYTDNWYRYAAYREQKLVRLMLSIEGIISPHEASYGVEFGDVASKLDDFADVHLFLKNIKPAGYRVVDDEPDGVADWTVNTSTINTIHLEAEDVQWVYKDQSLKVTESFKYKTGSLLVTEGGDPYYSLKITAAAPEQPATGSVWFPVEIPKLETTDGKSISSSEAGKVVAAWLNSSFGIVPFFGYRAEVRGSRAKYKTRQLRKVSVLNPSKLTRDQVDSMIDAYNEVENVEWDIIRNQLKQAIEDEDHPRYRLDEMVCNSLMNRKAKISQLHADLLKDIERLGVLDPRTHGDS